MNFKKIISCLFAVTLAFSFNARAEGTQLETASKNKAIIVVHGTVAGGLFYRDETCTKYYKNEAVWMPIDDQNKWRMIKGVAKFKLFYEDLFCDEDGNPLNQKIGLSLENQKFPHEVDEKIAKYGVWYAHKTVIDTLTEEFPEHEVFLHNYDWRLDLDIAAESLTKEIEKYDEVTLLGYSLGGIVSCKSAIQLYSLGKIDKIKKFITLATPYNGTMESLYVLEKGMQTENDFMSKVIEFLNIPSIISKMSHNCRNTYYMLPSKDYFERAKDGYVTTDSKGKAFDYEETLKFLKSRDYAKKSDGTNKPFLNKLNNVYDNLFVDGKHILNFLDYHLIVGCGLDTMSKMSVNPKKHGDIKILEYVDGDGSIALNESAIPFDGIEDNRIFKAKGRHQFLIGDSKVVENIVSTIKNSTCKSDEKLDLVS
ncbi:MAG: hypothetical protein LBP36_02365 [Oscillospiraceae bacterium]|jgi:hypothetical protein|nr:hypothetical protein [Oscillospiraceae bacterium]